MNIRRLPSWVLSAAHHKVVSGVWPEFEPLPMLTVEEMVDSTEPDDCPALDDRRATNCGRPLAPHEHLAEDVATLLDRDRDCRRRWLARRSTSVPWVGQALRPQRQPGVQRPTMSNGCITRNPGWAEAERSRTGRSTSSRSRRSRLWERTLSDASDMTDPSMRSQLQGKGLELARRAAHSRAGRRLVAAIREPARTGAGEHRAAGARCRRLADQPLRVRRWRGSTRSSRPGRAGPDCYALFRGPRRRPLVAACCAASTRATRTSWRCFPTSRSRVADQLERSLGTGPAEPERRPSTDTRRR